MDTGILRRITDETIPGRFIKIAKLASFTENGSLGKLGKILRTDGGEF